MSDRILIQPISGFPEWTPAERILEQRMLDTIRSGFERFGFCPIETPAVERNEVLTAKSGEETTKQIYQLSRLLATGDDDAESYSLHFDLTVPLARYVAQRHGELTFPFRRYQIQKVWRGERPQEGRFREFYQCDIDVIGNAELTLLADAEIPAVIYDIFSRLRIGNFQIRINNRKILGGFFTHLGVNSENIALALREVDRLERQGINRVMEGLVKLGLENDKAKQLIDFVTLSGNMDEMLGHLRSMVGINQDFDTGVGELNEVIGYAKHFGIPESSFCIDLSIARGLDYYTGTVYETLLVDHPGIGSICSGGRYDDLASYFIDRKFPGVGISIGLTRLFSQLRHTGIIQSDTETVAPVIMTQAKPEAIDRYLKLSTELREAGINTELYLEPDRLGKQLQYAGKKGFKIAAIVHESELANNTVTLRNLITGEQLTVPAAEVLTSVKEILSTF